MKLIPLILYKTIFFFDKFIKFTLKKSILSWFKDFLHKDSYKKIRILEKDISFFIPNRLTEWRVDTFFLKEPETLEWINNFSANNKFIFWDIGANIGLYSIYNALKNKNSTTFSFEPSSSNLRVLSRNISINGLENNIKIITLPLSDSPNKFFTLNENEFIEGGGLNTFKENYNFEGKAFITDSKYSLLGTSIDFLLENKILDFPDYIKIDVDGIEHLILKGAMKFLNNKKIKSLSIEINENFKEQYDLTMRIMQDNGFRLLHKKNSNQLLKAKKFEYTFNFIFVR